jgi:hypothetical protein
MKKIKILYWVSTVFIALFAISGLFFMDSPQAIAGVKHLGLPLWFHSEITIGKFIGGLIIVLPFIPKRLKEWVYVAMGIDMLSAVIALISVDGITLNSFSPLIAFGILLVSYICYHKYTQVSDSPRTIQSRDIKGSLVS